MLRPAAGWQDLAVSTQLGKRYRALDTGVTLLCTKAGAGVVKCNGQEMVVQQPKRLPSSD